MKIFKTLGIILLIIIAIVLLLLAYLKVKPAVPTDYQKTTKTGGNIEAKYLQNGPFEVVKKEQGVLLRFGKFLIFYPKELETSNKKYPVILIANGSGTPLSKYQTIAEHYASWGFIVIGTEEKFDWDGAAAEISLRYLERMHENQKIEEVTSIFYQKVDFEKVGIIGHSQGGVGVINAITDTKHKDIYKTAVSLSPTNKTLAHNLFWNYDARKINIPILLISGEGGGDDWVVTLDQLKEIYNDISAPKMALRRKATPHNEVLYKADGYIMAWFLWQLTNNEEAKKAFVGENSEIFQNELYTDLMSDLIQQ